MSEGPFNPVAPALANAIRDATGVRFTTLPLTRSRIYLGLAERDAAIGGEREQAPAVIALSRGRAGQILAPTGADLDLRRDQLTGDRRREHRVRGCRLVKLLVARDELELDRIEQRELLLQADREVGGLREGRVRGVDIELHSGWRSIR